MSIIKSLLIIVSIILSPIFYNNVDAETQSCDIPNGNGEKTVDRNTKWQYMWDEKGTTIACNNPCTVGDQCRRGPAVDAQRYKCVEDITYGECIVVSCDTGYKISGNTCVVDAPSGCGVDFYKNSSGNCTAVGNGYYSPGDNDTRYTCTNDQGDTNSRNYYYTGDGGGSNNCPHTSYNDLCGIDKYESSNGTCSNVGTGYYSPNNDNGRTQCTNGTTTNGGYTSDGGGKNSCSWSCDSGYSKSGSTCVDNTNPTGSVSYSPSGWTNGDVTVTVACSDEGSGCNMVSISGWTKSNNNYTKTFSSSHTANQSITIKDNSGNTKSITYKVTNIDKTKPTGEVEHNTGWYNSAQTITFSAKDTGGSRLKRIRLQQSVNGGSYQYIPGTDYNNLNAAIEVSKTFSRSAENGNNYRYRLVAWDYTGHYSIIYGPTTRIYFDTIPPAAPTIFSSTHTVDVWDKNDDPSFSITSAQNGVTNYYCIDSTNSCNPNISGSSKSYSNLSNGIRYFRAKSCDTGGCSGATSFKLKIDKTGPTGDTIYYVTDWTNHIVDIEIECSDSLSGCDLEDHPGWNKEGNDYYYRDFYENTDGVEYISMRDAAGNTTDVPYEISNIDTDEPTATVSYSPSSWTNGDVTVTIACSDSDSGCKMDTVTGWTKSGDNYIKTFSSNHTSNQAFTIKDNAGNTTSINYKVTNIDKTDPTATVSYSPSSWTNGSVTVTASCSDSGSGCSSSTFTTTVSSNQSGTIQISDNAGNTADISYNVTNIDTSDPSGTVSHNTGWYKTSQTITFSSSDTGGSKLKRMWLQESINGGNFTYISGQDYNDLNSSTTVTKTYTRSAVNGNEYRYRLVMWDYAGNSEIVNGPSGNVRFDTLPPSLPTISSSTHSNNVWNNNDDPAFSITKNGDGPSGSNSYYCLDTSNNCNPSIQGDAASYSNVSNATHYFRAKTCDQGGCSGVRSFTVKVDDQLPTATVSYSPSSWTNGSVTVTASCSDSGSGCSSSTFTKSVSSNGAGTISISDNAGNTANISYNVTNIDKTKPSGTVSHNTGWYKTSQTITFSSSDTGGSKLKRMWLQESINGGNFTYISGQDYNDLNSSTTVTKTYTRSAVNGNQYRYRLVMWDYAGNIEIVSGPSGNMRFDTLPPSLPTISSTTHSNNVWNNNDDPAFSITKNGDGPSGSNSYYCLDTSNNCNPSIQGDAASYSNVSNATHYFRAKTCDQGGCSGVRSFTLRVDDQLPTATVSYTPNTWTNNNVTVKITCSDTHSGCNMIGISGWSISGNTYSRTFSSNTTGNITIRDIAGNTSAIAYNVNKIDKTTPTISANNQSTTVWRNSKVDITLSVGDNGGSGIQYARYRWDNASCTTGANFTNGQKIQVPSEGTHTLYLCTSDVAGNTNTWNGVYKYDVTKPTVTDNYAYDNVWTNTGRTITLTPNDPNGTDHSGLASTKYCWGNTCIPSTGTTGTSIVVPPDRNNTLRYQSYDRAGNSSTIGSIVVKIEDNNPATTMSFTSGGNTYTPGSNSWTNQNVVATINCSDDTGSINSGCDTSSYEYRMEQNSFTCNDDTLAFDSYNGSIDISTPDNNNRVEYICSRVTDVAGNGYIYSPVYQVNIDKIIPNFSDVEATTGYPVDGDDLHANVKEFSYVVDRNSGSDIIEIEGYFEDSENNNVYLSKEVSINDTLEFMWDITKVDNDDTPDDGVRLYTFVVTKITDEAGNSIDTFTNNPVKTFKYFVYANPDTNLQTTLFSNELSGNNNFANGDIKKLGLKISDIYGNKIIPVSDIKRTINFTFEGQNTLKLDQYNPNLSDSSINLRLPKTGATYRNDIFNDGITSYENLESSDGEYIFQYKVYTPTFDGGANNGQEFLNGGASIDEVNIIVNQEAGVNRMPTTSFSGGVDIGGTIDFNFKPIIYTKFYGDFSREYSLNEELESNIKFTQANASSISGLTTYIGFGLPTTNTNSVHDKLDMLISSSLITEGHQSIDIGNLPNFSGLGDIKFDAEIKQSGGSLTQDEKNHYISTHIGYTIDGKDVLYNSDIIGKTNYSAGTLLDSSINLGVKVYGNVQSKNQVDLSQGQTGSDIYQLGNNSKAELREQIKKNLAEITHNVVTKNVVNLSALSGIKWSNSIDATKLLNEKILYITGNVNLDTIQKYSGNKTLVIKGGDLYIKNNLLAQNRSTDMLGIIVLADDEGNYGNVYVDTSVQAIEAIIYADKSMLNYDGTQVITDGSQLRNQFYYYGTLFSENTLGGYISQICPYFIDNCTSEESEKYDLNFFRSYYTYDGNNDGSKEQTKGSPYFPYGDDKFKYPVIFEYNPNIQNIPPLLFEINE